MLEQQCEKKIKNKKIIGTNILHREPKSIPYNENLRAQYWQYMYMI